MDWAQSPHFGLNLPEGGSRSANFWCTQTGWDHETPRIKPHPVHVLLPPPPSRRLPVTPIPLQILILHVPQASAA
ncbi:unnamed protein product [Protopolystoma xenopodis]|uniref:Uncharacterized protein n=1 Tax=Protopolystoma xenopodis TaxID=117903 RepID=A0A448XL98_9PLAT|nr:unnamed protein product [Protopolystoma xenopodis]